MEAPIKPDETDCCNSGCNPCILDIYEEQLKEYNSNKNHKTRTNLSKNCLKTTAYTVFKVINIEKHCEDAVLITFEYQEHLKAQKNDENLSVIYKPGQYFMLKMGVCNDEFQRAYTPIPINVCSNLQFTVLIKLYENGRMSKIIKKLQSGSKSIWRGPYGNFSITYSYRHILFIAQGVGIAPFYNIICNILENEECYTFLKLFYCCKKTNTIYLRDYLYNLQSYWNFSYEIFLSDNVDINIKYNECVNKFKLNEEVIKKFLFDKPDNSIQILICGNDNFMSYYKEIVLNCNVKDENIKLF